MAVPSGFFTPPPDVIFDKLHGDTLKTDGFASERGACALFFLEKTWPLFFRHGTPFFTLPFWSLLHGICLLLLEDLFFQRRPKLQASRFSQNALGQTPLCPHTPAKPFRPSFCRPTPWCPKILISSSYLSLRPAFPPPRSPPTPLFLTSPIGRIHLLTVYGDAIVFP